MTQAGLLDPDVIENPATYYDALLAGPALHRDAGTGFLVATRHEVVRAILRDNENFSARVHQPQLRPGGVPARVQEILARGIPPAHTIHSNDPPDHTRFRALVENVFSARRVRQMEAYIDGLVGELLDGFAGDGAVELISRFCAPLPLAVIADALGVPRADLPRIKAWSDANSELRGLVATEARAVRCAELVLECQEYFAARRAERRAAPRDDLLTDLVQARLAGEGRPLSEPELNSITFQFMVAGNETSTASIAEAVRKLAEAPEWQDRLRDDPALIPAFGEEILRQATPVQGVLRQAVRDVEIGGAAIPAGALVHLRLGAADRDRAVFAEPDRFDPARPNLNQHLGFGMGAHFCIGAMIARAELRLALRGLLGRLRDIRLTPGRNDFRHHPVFHLRGLRELHISFVPAR